MGRRILILDADLQDSPELLPEMMKLMDEGADVVHGVRHRREGETGIERATSALFYRLDQPDGCCRIARLCPAH
jgi:hypothetical protein